VLAALHRAVNDALRAVGFQPESRPFSPHLTLGRLREPADASFARGVQFESPAFTIDRLILFRSVLRPEGPEYSRLAEFVLS
jgi:2'-5' RNA ligase